MLATAQVIAVLFGIVIVLLSLWGIAYPERLLRVTVAVATLALGLRGHLDKKSGVLLLLAYSAVYPILIVG